MLASELRPKVSRDALPSIELFGQTLAPSAAKHRALRQLHEHFSELDPEATLAVRVESIEQLGKWLRQTGKAPAPPDAEPGDRPQIVRLRLLVRALDSFPACQRVLAKLLRNTLQQTKGVYLLARLGLPGDRGFLGETVDRLSRGFLPEPEDEHDLAQLIARLFPKQRDLEWLLAVPEPILVRAVELLRDPEGLGLSTWLPLREAACDALSLLATRISASGLSEALRVRSPACTVRRSPFYELARATDALIELIGRGDTEPVRDRAEACKSLVHRCQETCATVVQNLEEYGVSVDVVYRLELIGASLRRYESILEQLVCEEPRLQHLGARRQLVMLLDARRRDRDIIDITRTNLHLLARKIIERAGHTGEHYITETRTEYVMMWFSAAGGGFLTGGTTAVKFMVGWGHFAPFVEGLLASFNYAGTFLLMQLLGFTLATKQPSMIAAALAGTLRDSAGQQELGPLVKIIARITRSQVAAAAGNIGIVIPSAIAIDYAFRHFYGRPFLDEETAQYVLSSHNPLDSGTIFFAALTGVLLWASSVGAGWLENWAVYRRLPEAIAEHRIGRFIGRRTTRWASRVLSRNISGIGGNVTIGFLLGMTPALGKFFGVPLEVRHVTLSTGSLAFAVRSLGPEALLSSAFLGAAAGILVIACMNFGVSFVLALTVALRARGADRSDRVRLLRSVVATFSRSPMQFFFPPKADATVPVHGPVSVRPKPH
ncbi:MAG TPA: hypothetical protein VI072_16465 [Polyangiaceae bacterium]